MSGKSTEDLIEPIIRVQMGNIIYQLLSDSNKDNGWAYVTCGGRAIEEYLSEELQNRLASTGLYEKSFDYDLAVYPKDNTSDIPIYHPGYLSVVGHTYNDVSKTFTGINPQGSYYSTSVYEWIPFKTLMTGLQNMFNDKNNLNIFHRNDILTALDSLKNVIDINGLDSTLKEGNCFVPHFFMSNGKCVWRIFFMVPLLNKTTQRIELIDLKNAVRNIEFSPSGYPVLYDKNNNRFDGTDVHLNYDAYVRCTYRGGLTNIYAHVRSFWFKSDESGYNTSLQANTFRPKTESCNFVTIPTRIVNQLHIYILSPYSLWRDNGSLVGNPENCKDILKEKTDILLYKLQLIFNLSKYPSLPNFVGDKDSLKQAKDNIKYTEKYKKRILRVICLELLLNHIEYTGKDYEKTPLFGENIIRYFNLTTFDDTIAIYYNNDITNIYAANTGTKKKGQPVYSYYPVLSFLSDSRLLSMYFLANEKKEDISTVFYREKNQRFLSDLDSIYFDTKSYLLKNIRDVAKITLKSLDGGNVSYEDVGKKWTSTSLTEKYHWQGLATAHTYVDTLCSVQNTPKKFFQALKPLYKSKGIEAWLYDFIGFSFSSELTSRIYNPDKVYTTYRMTIPMGCFIQKDDGSYMKATIDNLDSGKVINLNKICSTTMNPTFIYQNKTNMDNNPILYLPLVQKSFLYGGTLYKFLCKKAGFMMIDELTAINQNEYEILIAPWAKFKIRSKSITYVAFINDPKTNNECITQYYPMRTITLEQIPFTFEEALAEADSTGTSGKLYSSSGHSSSNGPSNPHPEYQGGSSSNAAGGGGGGHVGSSGAPPHIGFYGTPHSSQGIPGGFGAIELKQTTAAPHTSTETTTSTAAPGPSYSGATTSTPAPKYVDTCKQEIQNFIKEINNAHLLNPNSYDETIQSISGAAISYLQNQTVDNLKHLVNKIYIAFDTKKVVMPTQIEGFIKQNPHPLIQYLLHKQYAYFLHIRQCVYVVNKSTGQPDYKTTSHGYFQQKTPVNPPLSPSDTKELLESKYGDFHKSNGSLSGGSLHHTRRNKRRGKRSLKRKLRR